VDDNDWEENSYKSSEDDESEEEDDTRELKGRLKWLKKTEDTGVSEKRKRRVKTGKATEKDYEAIKPDRRAVSWNMQDMMTEEELDKKVSELVASRGRKSTDNRVILRQLEVLTKAARIHGPKKEIPVLAHLIAAMFDSNRLIDEYMELQQWRTCQRSLSRILKLIEQNKSLTLGTVTSDLATGAADPEAAALDKKSNVVKIVGSIDSFILRLEDEYVKSLQQINPHTQVLPPWMNILLPSSEHMMLPNRNM
jgi:translation initiation factor 3 subunit C